MEIFVYGSSGIYRSRPDVLGRFAGGPTWTFSDTVPCKGLSDSLVCKVLRVIVTL